MCIKFETLLVAPCWISQIIDIILGLKVSLFCLITLARKTWELEFQSDLSHNHMLPFVLPSDAECVI